MFWGDGAGPMRHRVETLRCSRRGKYLVEGICGLPCWSFLQLLLDHCLQLFFNSRQAFLFFWFMVSRWTIRVAVEHISVPFISAVMISNCYMFRQPSLHARLPIQAAPWQYEMLPWGGMCWTFSPTGKDIHNTAFKYREVFNKTWLHLQIEFEYRNQFCNSFKGSKSNDVIITEANAVKFSHQRPWCQYWVGVSDRRRGNSNYINITMGIWCRSQCGDSLKGSEYHKVVTDETLACQRANRRKEWRH